MADSNKYDSDDKLNIRYLGRIGQIRIFLGKLLRMFIYQSDWITIPMAALIAGLVALALGKDFGITKEGTLMGVFALMCVCLWNGTFNSIQIICRERDVIKREHRSGMHISSYIAAHMLYQAIICSIQVVVTLLTAFVVGMRITGEGLFTPYLAIDVGITLFLITFAADMLALFISSVVRTTTVAMTIMPFVLIFQMVFSGGLFPLPDNIDFITKVTISEPAFDSLASQMNADELPYKSIEDMFSALENMEMDVNFKGSDILDMLSEDNPNINDLRSLNVGGGMTVRQLCDKILTDDSFADVRRETLINRITVGSLLDAMATGDESIFIDLRNTTIEGQTTPRGAIELILTDPNFNELRNEPVAFGITIGQVLNGIIYIADSIPEINEVLCTPMGASVNMGDVINMMRTNENFSYLYDITLLDDTSIGEALRILMNTDSMKGNLDNYISYNTTVGEIIDYLKNTEAGDEYKDVNIVYHVKFSDILDKMGKDNIKKLILEKTSSKIFNASYKKSASNILTCYLRLLLLIAINSIAAIVALEFIDKDKR